MRTSRSFHLVARLVYRNGCRILGDLNMIEKRPTQEAPTTFVTEEEVAKQLTTITAYVNSSLHAAYALALGESTSLVLKVRHGARTGRASLHAPPVARPVATPRL